VASSAFSIELPASSTTGSYTLSWSVTGLATSSWSIQEAPNTSFSNITSYISYDTTAPYQYAFSGKANGTYCYRIAYLGSWSAPACITVAQPAAATLRITNNTRYDLVDLRLNGVQQLSYPYVILPGASADFVYNSATSVTINGGVGFYNSNGNRDIWFTYGPNTVPLTAGQTYPFGLNNPTIQQMLTGFSASQNWDGIYYCSGCSSLVQYGRFSFTSGGAWTFYRNGVQESLGNIQLVSWPNYASIITFRLCSTCDNIQLPYPFGSFLYRNGSPDWPIVEYVAQ
jgi:hypothetical protein